MLRESQRFRDHMDGAYLLLYTKFQNGSNSAQKPWLSDELSYADSSLLELMKLDEGHQNALLRIDDFIITLPDPGKTRVGLNETARSDFIKTFHSIGNNVVDAYGNLINFTSVNDDTGPPLWYFRPSPPDEAILQETVNLAINAKAIISS